MPKGIYSNRKKNRKSRFDTELVRKLYYEIGMTQQEIADQIGASLRGVQGVMRRNGMTARKAAPRSHLVGPLHPLFKKECKNYKVLHKRLYRLLGQPKKCEVCLTESAKRYDWANMSGKYEDPKDYKRMCRSCHSRHDGKIKNIRGK